MKLQEFEGVKEIPLTDLIIDKDHQYQERNEINRDMVNAIIESLADGKINQPLAVTLSADGAAYVIVDGTNRYTACVEKGLETVPCTYMDPDQAKIWGLKANILRSDYNAVEKAKALAKLKEREGVIDNTDLAKLVGLHPATVGDYLVINELDDRILDEAIKLNYFSLKELAKIARKGEISEQDGERRRGRKRTTFWTKDQQYEAFKKIADRYDEKGFKIKQAGKKREKVDPVEKALGSISVSITSLQKMLEEKIAAMENEEDQKQKKALLKNSLKKFNEAMEGLKAFSME